MSDMCDQCAFRKTCATWHEPRNRLVSQICAAGPLPFCCHANLDWGNPLLHVMPVGILVEQARRAGGMKICTGWKRAVAARRWPSDPALRRYQRWLAKHALLTAEEFMAGRVTVRELHRDLAPLADYYQGPRAWQIERMMA